MENNTPVLTKDNLPDLIRSVSRDIIPKELRSYILPALEEFKNEIAEEIGIENYDLIDKGELPSRLNGNVGGSMTKKMVLFAQAVLAWNYKKKLALDNEREQTDKMISDGF
ncbi:MAG: alpha/beta-type small acid-soluble spore protein [Eubacteriales bacterium]|jgi:hypothetical protein